MNVLIIPDKFKGTLTARAAGEAIARGWASARPGDTLEILPMSDGGDGFGEVIGGMMGLQEQRIETRDSAGRTCMASFWARGEDAVIEAAQVNGLAHLPPRKYHPFDLDTFGLREVFQRAEDLGASKMLVGIGGSSTNDGGFGLALAMGWRFFDERGAAIERWTDLDRLHRVEPPARLPAFSVTAAVDVQNPLLGPSGASRIYGPQKGLREQDMPKAEACLGALAAVMRDFSGIDYATVPGTGAAGGLGFGLLAFLDAKFVPGSEIFAKAAHLDERLKTAQLVISGEGSIDAQSLMGKGVGELFERCRRAGVARMGLAGSLGPGLKNGFPNDPQLALAGIVPNLTSLANAKAEPARWLAELAAQAAKNWDIQPLRA